MTVTSWPGDLPRPHPPPRRRGHPQVGQGVDGRDRQALGEAL